METSRWGGIALVLGCLGALLSAGCGGKPAPAPPAGPAPGVPTTPGRGTLVVTGKGGESWQLLDRDGSLLTSVKLNEVKELEPGMYMAQLGNRRKLEVKAGERTTLAAGTLALAGPGKESAQLFDEDGALVTSVKSDQERDLLPGNYAVLLGNRIEAVVKGGERTAIAVGTVLVTGTGKETYQLWDRKGQLVTSPRTNEERELLPGPYAVQLGNRPDLEVKGGERTTLAAGTLVVAGAGTDSCPLFDGKGQLVTSVKPNEEKELMPGNYTVQVGGKDLPVEIAAGRATTVGR